MRKSSKDCRADKANVNSRIQAEAYTAIKAPRVMTGSAIDPSYLFTSSCTDPKRRTGPAFAELRRKKVQSKALHGKILRQH
ncbi:MAG: hypothetical protein E7247_15650 [Paenibacillaceae bacterium]|nr:hypothetical protein [Paenibacillaceae bacterium]